MVMSTYRYPSCRRPAGERPPRALQRLEGRLQVGDGLVPGVHGGRRLAGPQRLLDHLGLVGQRAGQAQVQGGGRHPGGIERAGGLDRRGGTQVQALAAGQPQSVTL
jgi:hypothetical protein